MDWQITISLITLALVIFGIIWGNGLWVRRERIEIVYPNMLVQLKTNEVNGIHFECNFRLTYVQGLREQYVSKIFIKFDKSSWERVRQFYKIPINICKGINHDARVRLPIGHQVQFGHDAFFPTRRDISVEKLEEINNIVQALTHKYKIGWEDTYKNTHWKTVNQLRAMRKEEVM